MTRFAEVSVLVATRERPNALARCLDGLLRGDVVPREVVIVDQSAGPTPVQISHGGVAMVVVNDREQGLSRARNLALRAARYPLVAVLDDDCVPAASWLAAIERGFAVDSIDAVAGPVLPLPVDGSAAFALSSRPSLRAAEYTWTAAPWRVGTGGNFAVRTERLRELGGYDERLGAGSSAHAGEDLDLIHRLLRSGATIRYIPDALVYHARADAARRRATRTAYGRGAGAFIGARLRARDFSALPVLARWLVERTALVSRAAVRRDRRRVVEEALVLAGTLGGLVHGLRARDPRRAR